MSDTPEYTKFYEVEDETGRRSDALDMLFASSDMSTEAYEEGRASISRWVSEQYRLVRKKGTDDSIF